jgi:uncharacterized membrane protein
MSRLGWHRISPPALILLLLISIYFLAAMCLSVLRVFELQTGNWDLGIFQQAFWSTAHGHPLYEAGDYEMSGAQSLFQIHPALLLVPLGALYSAAPTPLTLFGTQTAAVALAALPLYYIAKDATGSDRRALLVAGLYLIWPPLLAANLYDFHLEAFLPLELFALFLFWSRQRYLLGFLAAGFAWITLQVGPVFVAFVAVYFLWPSMVSCYRSAVRRLPARPGSETTSLPARWARLSKPFWNQADLASVSLGAGSVVAYALFLFFQNHPGLVLLFPVPVAGNPSVPFTGGSLYISLQHLTPDFLQKVGFWLLLYALVGFLPWWAPRTQILVLPWFAYTFVSHSEFTVFGNQYGFLPVFPLMVGFAYGLGRLFPPSDVRAVNEPLGERGSRRGRPLLSAPGSASFLGPGSIRRVGAFLVIGCLILCALLSPADPLAQGRFAGNGYDVSYLSEVPYSEVKQLMNLVPANATVLSSNDLFTFFANDIHAYALLWTTSVPPFLPFNQSHLPTFLAIDSTQWNSVPAWLMPLVGRSSLYEINGSVSMTSGRTITLYQLCGS